MPWWFHALTPFGWINFYFTITLIVHELGHLVMGLLTGHKITGFKVGLCDPVIQFQVGNIPFEFSFDAMGGSVSCDNTKHVSQIGFFLTAMAGPVAVLLFATSILVFTVIFLGQDYESKTWQFFCQKMFLTLSFMTYLRGLGNIVRDFKNILVSKN